MVKTDRKCILCKEVKDLCEFEGRKKKCNDCLAMMKNKSIDNVYVYSKIVNLGFEIATKKSFRQKYPIQPESQDDSDTDLDSYEFCGLVERKDLNLIIFDNDSDSSENPFSGAHDSDGNEINF